MYYVTLISFYDTSLTIGIIHFYKIIMNNMKKKGFKIRIPTFKKKLKTSFFLFSKGRIIPNEKKNTNHLE